LCGWFGLVGASRAVVLHLKGHLFIMQKLVKCATKGVHLQISALHDTGIDKWLLQQQRVLFSTRPWMSLRGGGGRNYRNLNGNSALSPSFAVLLPSPTLVLVGVPQARRKNLIDLREKHRH
jgi:hypothetical protein